MTSKLKCPFCKEEIISDLCLMCDKIDKGYINGRQIYKCNKCGLLGNKELWQALIQAKQDLKIAVDALKRIKDFTAWGTLYQEQELAIEALEQITHDNSEKTNSVEHKEI